MKIYSDILYYKNDHNIEPNDIIIYGTNYLQSEIIFRYKVNDSYYFINNLIYKPSNEYLYMIFLELINNSYLWSIKYKHIKLNDKFIGLKIIILLNTDIINNYINSSLGLYLYILKEFNNLKSFHNMKFENISYIPYINNTNLIYDKLKIKLYNYQEKSLIKMINIENNNINDIEYYYNFKFNDINVLLDPLTNKIINKPKLLKIKTNGGILADDMGLGKTITSIALIQNNKSKYNDFYKLSKNNYNKIYSPATLIICPSHLIKQWELEIKKLTNLKYLIILSKSSYNKLTINDFLINDVIITSYNFIMNFKFYQSLYYDLTNNITLSNFDHNHKNYNIRFFLNKIKNNNIEDIKKINNPIFEFFYFHRVILDEGHEIFGYILSEISACEFMTNWILNLDSDYSWVVSGTILGLDNCFKFINLSLDNTSFKILDKEYICNNILKEICIRHRKEDILNEINIPGYDEEIIWVNFTNTEKQLYDIKKTNKVNNIYLQQFCCHPLIIDSTKKIYGNEEIDINLMYDKLLKHHENNIINYTNKINNLDKKNQAYSMIKKNYEIHISESKYLINILEKINSEEFINENNCSICLDEIIKPTLTSCGHLYCYNCIKLCLNNKSICPMCKTNIKDLLIINNNNISNDNNLLINKYGSKLGKLISIIRTIILNENNKIIIFSQWDNMLSLIGKTLSINNISNSFVKGNIHSKNLAINKFKSLNNNENKILMLSLKNAASGTNLTEATHIIFIEPINLSKNECLAIESQAIARACRIGQQNKIKVIRILTKDSIEEEIYNKNYI